MNLLWVENHATFARTAARSFLAGHAVTVVPTSHDHIVDQERQDVQGADDAEEEIPTLNLFMTVGLLVVVTVVSCPSFSHCACKTFNRFPDCRYHRRIPCLVHQRIDSR